MIISVLLQMVLILPASVPCSKGLSNSALAVQMIEQWGEKFPSSEFSTKQSIFWGNEFSLIAKVKNRLWGKKIIGSRLNYLKEQLILHPSKVILEYSSNPHEIDRKLSEVFRARKDHETDLAFRYVLPRIFGFVGVCAGLTAILAPPVVQNIYQIMSLTVAGVGVTMDTYFTIKDSEHTVSRIKTYLNLLMDSFKEPGEKKFYLGLNYGSNRQFDLLAKTGKAPELAAFWWSE